MTEAVLVLGLLVRQFHIKRADAKPLLPMAIITTQPDHAAPGRTIATRCVRR